MNFTLIFDGALAVPTSPRKEPSELNGSEAVRQPYFESPNPLRWLGGQRELRSSRGEAQSPSSAERG